MALPQLERRRFTDTEVEAMLAAGVLAEDEPLELLDGELCLMSPQSPAHASTADRARRLLEGAYGDDYFARMHSPLRVDAESLPEPDLAVVRGDVDHFETRHPGGTDVVLVLEIAATSHDRDRWKAALYARAGVPVYWLLDLAGRRLEIRGVPEAGEYRVLRSLAADEEVELPELDTSIRVASLLPR